MAGTRYILAGYLRAVGLGSEVIEYLITELVQSPGYPSYETIERGFRRFGMELSTMLLDGAGLITMTSVALTQVFQPNAEYVLLLRMEEDKVIYLNGRGEIVSLPYKRFVAIWTGKIFTVTVDRPDLLIARIKEIQEANKPKNRAKVCIADIKESSHMNEPLVYRGCRIVSAYLSYFFIRLKIHPNVITFSWLIPVIIAAFLLSAGNSLAVRLVSAAMILLGYTLDCSDGEVARIAGQYSRIGGYLDLLIHWIGGPLLILGVTMGLYRNTHDTGILLTGLKAMFGGALYNYLSIQLNSWSGHANPYTVQHSLLLPLFWFFPLDLNIFLVGAVFNRLSEALELWGTLSYILSFLIAGVFFFKELQPDDQT